MAVACAFSVSRLTTLFDRPKLQQTKSFQLKLARQVELCNCGCPYESGCGCSMNTCIEGGANSDNLAAPVTCFTLHAQCYCCLMQAV